MILRSKSNSWLIAGKEDHDRGVFGMADSANTIIEPVLM